MRRIATQGVTLKRGRRSTKSYSLSDYYLIRHYLIRYYLIRYHLVFGALSSSSILVFLVLCSLSIKIRHVGPSKSVSLVEPKGGDDEGCSVREEGALEPGGRRKCGEGQARERSLCEGFEFFFDDDD